MLTVFVGIILIGKFCLKQLKDMAMPVEHVARPFAKSSHEPERSIARNLFPEEVDAKQTYQFFEEQEFDFDKAPELPGSFRHEEFLGLEQKQLHGGSSSLLDDSQVEQPEVAMPDDSQVEQPEVAIPDDSQVEQPEVAIPDDSQVEQPEVTHWYLRTFLYNLSNLSCCVLYSLFSVFRYIIHFLC